MSRPEPRLAIDLDDVLFDFIGQFFAWHNELYGTRLRPDETVFEKLWEAWGGTREEAAERVPRFFREIDMLDTAPMAGAIEALTSLKQSYSLTIVSARDPQTLISSTDWVAKYFPELFDDIILGIGNPMAQGRVQSKTEVCLNLGARLLIDDQLVHALEAARAGIPVLLFGHRPWNQAVDLPPIVRRVAGWPEVQSILLEDGRPDPG